ncbi:hypothetical protein E2C01_056749 [Portunus trituberculatus]|uniref:Uncharacterized protein n=1 Tax=Portunus trituberculatus TaxID=210409 RepID=A0A5B7GRN6_PORTR|nr:hypothetical protein [Portunus trituberculatus]
MNTFQPLKSPRQSSSQGRRDDSHPVFLAPACKGVSSRLDAIYSFRLLSSLGRTRRTRHINICLYNS